LGESAIKVKDAVAVQGMTRELENISSNAAASERNIVVRLEVAGGLRRN